jgi:hypothetical protein
MIPLMLDFTISASGRTNRCPGKPGAAHLFFWDFVIDLITGAMFLLTGYRPGRCSAATARCVWARLLLYGVAISLVAIVVRFVWVFPATYLPRWALPRLVARDPAPPWPEPFVVALTGVRGVVSLAAALRLNPGRVFYRTYSASTSRGGSVGTASAKVFWSGKMDRISIARYRSPNSIEGSCGAV